MSTSIEIPWQPSDFRTDNKLYVATFTANDEHLVSNTMAGVRVWRVADGKQVAMKPVGPTFCVAASNDGRWIAAGTVEFDEASGKAVGGKVIVWDATSYEQVFVGRIEFPKFIFDLDFSPDSTRLVSAKINFGKNYGTATIWDIRAGRKVRTLDHNEPIGAAKYSPRGDRIATATEKCVGVWDSNDGRLLVDINVQVGSPRGLLWCKDHLFILAEDGKIKEIDAATGSTVSEWPVPHNEDSYIALPPHRRFIASVAGKTVTFWDISTHSELGSIQHTHDILSISYSSDGQLLAITTEVGIIVKDLTSILSRLVPEPELVIDNDVLDAWKCGQFAEAEALLSAAILTSENRHHVLASRALVRARSGQWDAALVDAKESIDIKRSPVGYIAKCVALVGNGEMDSGCRVCDIASLHFPSDHLSLLLIKAIVLFMAGKHVDAISRIDDLITESTDLWPDPALYVVQAYMRLLIGNKYFESSDYARAIQSFDDARVKLGNHTRQPPLMVSLISGWEFDHLAITISQRLCGALFAADRIKEAAECVLRMVNQGIGVTEVVNTWVSDFKSRCRSKLEDLGDSAMNVERYDEAVSQYATALLLDSPSPQDLLMKRSNASMRKGAREDAINDAKEWARSMLTSGTWKDALNDSVGFILERFTVYRAVCERLEETGFVANAVACFQQVSSELAQETDGEQANWTRDFKFRCRQKLETLGDCAVNIRQYDEAVSQYTAALSLDPATPQELLMKRSNACVRKGAREDALNDAKGWVALMLTSGSWTNALTASAGVGICLPRYPFIYQAVCEHLKITGHVTDAVACFHQMTSKLAKEMDGEKANWTHDFKSRCRKELEDLGDSALNTKKYDEAVSQYTTVLSLDPASPQDLLVKRSRAYAQNGKWEDALSDANEVIKLDPPSPSGYEKKYAALLGIGHHDEAIGTFETMLSKMADSSDSEIREQSRHYVRPEQTKEAIRRSIKNAIRDSPLVLINALSGCLCNKSEQASAFESTPAFTTLVASTTTYIDHALIERVVAEFYRYTTFSHTWEGHEPLYENVTKVVVYDLKTAPTHEKLKMFCKIVRDEGFMWAWSDTCCIDQKNPMVLQESLVSMFKWYEGSEMTIVFLFDVDGLAELGALMMSKWNSRGWTLQEYHASKVVRIYTKDWTPYLGLTIHNHKESPSIISEMEKATGISAEALRALRPGLKDIRQKLCLASTRQTTRVEDAAYSLLGIFSMTLRVSYGEGDKALGRLLSELLMSSGDTSILAWTGTPNSFNSCLPTDIIVFSQPAISHIPAAIPDTEMEIITDKLSASELDLDLVAGLYDQVDGLPTPTFAAQRMRLPCLAFKIRAISRFQSGVFRAQAGALGVVEIKCRKNLAGLDSLYLVHPWIDFLLDRHLVDNIGEIEPDEDELSEPDESPSPDSFPDPTSDSDADRLDEFPPSPVVPLMDVHMKFLARLGQPFGALLLAPIRKNTAEYRRIATENLITAQVEITPATLNRLTQGVRVLDVL